jgi:hypothetical protein
VATAAAALTDEAFVATGTVNFSGNPTITDTILSSLDTGKTLEVSGNLTWGTTAAKVIQSGATINVSGDVTQLAGGTTLTVNGTLNVTGTYRALTGYLIAAQYIDGSGTVDLGALEVISASGATSFDIKTTAATKIGDVTITSVSPSGSAKLIITTSAEISGTATITKATADATIEGASSGETLTFKDGSELIDGGASVDLKGLVDTTYTSDTLYTWGGAAWS